MAARAPVRLRRRVRALGHDVRLLLDAEPGPAAVAALTAAEQAAVRLDGARARRHAASGVRAPEPALVRTGPAAGELCDPDAEECDADPIAALRRRVEDPRVAEALSGRGGAADRAAAILATAGPCLVDADGAIAVRGAWPVGVETTGGVLTLEVADGGVATWGATGRRRRRAAPSGGDLLRASVIAPSAAEADVLARALVVAGARAAEREADAAGIMAVLVRADGRTVLAGGLA